MHDRTTPTRGQVVPYNHCHVLPRLDRGVRTTAGRCVGSGGIKEVVEVVVPRRFMG